MLKNNTAVNLTAWGLLPVTDEERELIFLRAQSSCLVKPNQKPLISQLTAASSVLCVYLTALNVQPHLFVVYKYSGNYYWVEWDSLLNGSCGLWTPLLWEKHKPEAVQCLSPRPHSEIWSPQCSLCSINTPREVDAGFPPIKSQNIVFRYIRKRIFYNFFSLFLGLKCQMFSRTFSA